MRPVGANQFTTKGLTGLAQNKQSQWMREETTSLDLQESSKSDNPVKSYDNFCISFAK
jgi:hypothetical protein